MTAAKAQRRRRKSGDISERKALQLLAILKRAKPAMTTELVEELEKAVQADKFGITRRGALAALTRTGRQLLDGVAKNRQAAVAVAAFNLSIVEYVGALESLKSLMDTAYARMAIALASREDMSEIIAEAKAQLAEDTDKPRA